MNDTLNVNREPMHPDDTLLDYFSSVKSLYPHLVFTNLNAKNVVQRRAVYIYPRDLTRRSNVYIQLWYRTDHRDYWFKMKKSIMTEEEKNEAAQLDKKATSQSGAIWRSMTFKDELLDYVLQKLDMIAAQI